MAPVEPDFLARSNVIPVSLFAGQILLVLGLTTKVLISTRRAAQALAPSTTTRVQQEFRRRHAFIFSTLAFLSLTFVTTFAVIWRASSYLEWAAEGNHETPGSLWTGWYGTGDEGVGRWRLGDWLSDRNLIVESDSVAVARPEGFFYTSEHYVGLLAASIFMGVEGRRRNLSASTIASFVVLSVLGSLGFALSLFFTTILYTPVSVHSGPSRRDDVLFAPKSLVYNLPVALSIIGVNALPTLLKRKEDVDLLRVGYVELPLFLAFAPKIIPGSWGRYYASKASAHRSFSSAFFLLSILSFALHWKNLGYAFFVNTPQKNSYVYDLVTNFGRRDRYKSDRFLTGLAITASKLKHVSGHPAISVTTSDMFFSTVSLLAWTFTRDLDVTSILNNSIFSFLAGNSTEKHVEFADKVERLPEVAEDKELDDVPTTTPKRRSGRPRKANLTNGNSSVVPSTGSPLRRSTRNKSHSDYESDGELAYKPSAAEKQAVVQIEADGSPSEDLVHGGEATAVALALAFLGGLGQLSAGVLGAEVTGSNE